MLLDTDVLVDVLRGYAPAVSWLTNYTMPIGVSGLVAMELLQGCRNLAEQRRVQSELARFTVHWPTLDDCQKAYAAFAAFRLSDGLGLLDSLIGQTAVGLNEELATFNRPENGAAILIGGGFRYAIIDVSNRSLNYRISQLAT